MSNCSFFTCIDLKSGFHPLPVAEECRDYLTMSTPAGNYRYRTLPMGIQSATALFQKTLNQVMGDLLFRHRIVFVNDIHISSQTFVEHLESLRLVLERLQNANFTLNADKCSFACPSAKILGYVVSQDGLAQDDSKVAAVRNYPVPETVTQLRTFVGMCSFYRIFISNFSKICAPLTDLYSGKHKPSKHQRLDWKESHQENSPSLNSL